MRLLAGDVGGTHTRLLLAELDAQGRLHAQVERHYDSSLYSDLDLVVEEFLAEQALAAPPEGACFAVAGPVRGRRARITNLPWGLDAELLERRLNIGRVHLINDFEGIGYGLDLLPPDGLVELQAGEPLAGAPRALLGAGTGLGQALLFSCAGRYQVVPTEGGHVDFAPRGAEESALLGFLRERLGRVSYEAVLSGAGLVRIFEFLQETGRARAGPRLAEALAEGGDPAPLISDYALRGEDPAAAAALQRFVAVYGGQAGNLALSCVPRGGLYLAGGIAVKILPALQEGSTFLEAFCDKPPMRELLHSIPVHVIREPRVGLLGACEQARRLALA